MFLANYRQDFKIKVYLDLALYINNFEWGCYDCK